jgi:long-subunit fatty acid transport protein
MSVLHPVRPVSLASRLGRAALAVLPLTLLLASPATAGTDEEMFRAMRFQSPTPGSVAGGMGGAFIGQADDSTSMVTNPAGLAYLSRPELQLEISGYDPDEVAFQPPGTFDLAGVETYARGLALIDEEAHSAIPFFGYAHPLTDRVVLGFFRHERHDVEREFATGFFSSAFPTFEGSSPGVEREALFTQGTIDFLVDTWGASVGVVLHEQFSLGLSVALARLDVAARSDNFQGVPFDGNLNGTPDQLLRSLDYTTIIDDEDTQITFTAGFLWKAHPKISVGAVYRDGAQFEVIEDILSDGIRGQALRDYVASRVASGSIKGNASGQFINSFDTPDSYGIGVSFGPFLEPRGGGGLTINADAVRVEYTDLLEGFVAGFSN